MGKEWDDLSEFSVEKEIQEVERKNLLIVDGNNLAYRYYNRPNFDNYYDDYVKTITSLGKSYSAKKIICTFDSGSLYRKTIFPEYKANRDIERTEEEQERYEAFFDCLNEIIDSLPFDNYRFKGVEADDLIAYLALNSDFDTTWIISSDRDLYQLLNSKTKIYNIFSRKEITVTSLKEKYNLTPMEYMWMRIIEGDKGDNINGIDGIGEKRATALIKDFGSLRDLIEALPIKGKAKYIANLNAGKESLILYEKLMNLKDYNTVALSYAQSDNIMEILNNASKQ